MAGSDGQSETQQLELTVHESSHDEEEEQEEMGEEQGNGADRGLLGGVVDVWQTAISHRHMSVWILLGNWYMLQALSCTLQLGHWSVNV